MFVILWSEENIYRCDSHGHLQESADVKEFFRENVEFFASGNEEA